MTIEFSATAWSWKLPLVYKADIAKSNGSGKKQTNENNGIHGAIQRRCVGIPATLTANGLGAPGLGALQGFGLRRAEAYQGAVA